MDNSAMTVEIPTELRCDNVYKRYEADRLRVIDMLTEAAETTKRDQPRMFKRVSRMKYCGGEAVGISLFDAKGDQGPSEKVHHGRCRDRVCPVCQAIGNAGVAAKLGNLIEGQFNDGERLVFLTLTVRHKKTDRLRDTRKALDRAWALFIRRAAFRRIFPERHRVAEVEYTKTGGWHPHFHLLLKMNPNHASWHWRRDYLEQQIRDLWAECTSKQGRDRRSYQVRLIEIQRGKKDGHVVRRWVEKGTARIEEVPIAKMVDELTKYVTKRQADGKKTNQISFWDWTPEMVREYVEGVRGWNLHRSSKGWAEIQQAFEDSQDNIAEIADAVQQGGDFLNYAELCRLARLGADHTLSKTEADYWADISPRVLGAFEREGANISADQLRGYILRFWGDTEASVKRLKPKPWQTLYVPQVIKDDDAKLTKADRRELRREKARKRRKRIAKPDATKSFLEGAA